MAEFKLFYRHRAKDLQKFGYAKKEWDLSNLRLGNDTFIELGRAPGQIERTFNMIFGLTGFFVGIMGFSLVSILLFEEDEYRSNWTTAAFVLMIFLSIYIISVSFFQWFGKSVFWPAEYPVRFNRKTGKVYVYEPQLSKREFYFPMREIIRLYKPVIKVFDWQDIEGMTTRAGYTFMQVIVAAVIDRKEDIFIDHFILWDNADTYNNEEWRWLLSYMDGMEGMNYKGKIRGRFWVGRLLNFIAPEFHWPEGIDKASRAESMAELAKIEQQYDLVGKHYPYEQP